MPRIQRWWRQDFCVPEAPRKAFQAERIAVQRARGTNQGGMLRKMQVAHSGYSAGSWSPGYVWRLTQEVILRNRFQRPQWGVWPCLWILGLLKRRVMDQGCYMDHALCGALRRTGWKEANLGGGMSEFGGSLSHLGKRWCWSQPNRASDSREKTKRVR